MSTVAHAHNGCAGWCLRACMVAQQDVIALLSRGRADAGKLEEPNGIINKWEVYFNNDPCHHQSKRQTVDHLLSDGS